MSALNPATVPRDVDPAALFGILWPLVAPRIGEIISEPWDAGGTSEFGPLSAAVFEARGPHLPPEILTYLQGGTNVRWQTPPDDPGRRAFVVMRVLDRAFRAVLPESACGFGSAVCAKPGPLLERMKHRYYADGCLATVDAGHVVLLGPLAKGGRAEAANAANGDLFEQQFVNLTVIAPRLNGWTLSFRTLAPSEFLFPPGAVARVGVAPIAQDRDDLVFASRTRGHNCYLDARPADSAATADRLIDVLGTLLSKDARVVAMPELVQDTHTIDTARAWVKTQPHDGARVLVLGTGLSSEKCDRNTDLHFNEAVVCDGRGKVLFRQRKNHHYSMSAKRMDECEIAKAGNDDHIEDCAPGRDLMICDFDGLGRLVVLICEDLAQDDPGRQIARRLTPDWIITPVLDIGLNPGRWPHQKAIGLSNASKVVVSGSTTLSVRKAKLDRLDQLAPQSGVAMLFNGAERGATRMVTVGCLSGANASAVIDWDPPTWPKTDIGTAA